VVYAVQSVGTLSGTGSVLNGKFQESADNSTWSDVSGAAFATASLSETTQVLSFSHALQYLRYQGAVSGTLPQVPVSVVANFSRSDTDTVLAAFQAALLASPSTAVALSGGLWANEVPEDRELPYGFIELLDSRFLWTTEDFHVEVAKVRLHVYAVGGQNCESLTRQVRQLYDWNNLPFSAADGGSSTCQVMPTDYCVQSEFARLNTGQIVYQGTVEYEAMINRNTLRG
jgi:hypothetical protein